MLPVAGPRSETPPQKTARADVGEEEVDRTFTADVGGGEQPANSRRTLPQRRRFRHKSRLRFCSFIWRYQWKPFAAMITEAGSRDGVG